MAQNETKAHNHRVLLPPIDRHFAAVLRYVAHAATRPSLPALDRGHERPQARITHLKS